MASASAIPRRVSACGFTLLEAMISTGLVAMAGGALLLGVAASIDATQAAQEQTIAEGLAIQLMDEIAGKQYSQVRSVPNESTLGPAWNEMSGGNRAQYNDIDDYHGVRESPPKDMFGVALGADNGIGGTRHANFRSSDFLTSWRQEVDVYYVNDNDLQTPLTAGQTSGHKRVEIRIYVDDPNGARRRLTTMQRVFAHMPSL